ncbi:ABC transporter permease [Acidisphaera rubrifaciens]|uniref:ABC transporter amino acid permease n=1 Tax=Acidisphaera rubrifaciens HS-AP3 TaxID=1231350 RepID=A0A0D6PAJ3_9PROT|nr:ABC transporter permease [Acidisphaera rubrifaciens]GAN77894.1 ABC transporter amino acid permease [Acidisphaera rubrifaciens HS-AP3]
MLLDLMSAAIRIATPLMFAALGGILSERAGVFAVGLEGMMLCGAFGATVGSALGGGALAGIAASMLCGALLAGVVVLVAVRAGADNMVTGLAANILALGLTSFLLRALFGHGAAAALHVALLPAIALPGLAAIPRIGPALFVQPPLTWAALVAVVPLTLFLTRTAPGLTLRAVGENPLAAYGAGADPGRVRALSVLACGAVAGLGGAVLCLQQVGTFTDGMTFGRGYLALAAIIVGRWMPYGTVLACLVFGAAEALDLRVQIIGLPISSYYVQMLPYVVALLVLVALGRAARLPAAIGTHFDRDAT